MSVDLRNTEVVEGFKVLDRKQELRSHKGYWVLRRGQDVFIGGLALVVLSLILLLTALSVLIDGPHGSQILNNFAVDKMAKKFYMYKFLSMYMDAEKKLEELLQANEMNGPAFKIKDDPRITRVGKFIRKTSIDEFPQLWNILKGDMIIVDRLFQGRLSSIRISGNRECISHGAYLLLADSTK